MIFLDRHFKWSDLLDVFEVRGFQLELLLFEEPCHLADKSDICLQSDKSLKSFIILLCVRLYLASEL
jgi:hypothetical protein